MFLSRIIPLILLVTVGGAQAVIIITPGAQEVLSDNPDFEVSPAGKYVNEVRTNEINTLVTAFKNTCKKEGELIRVVQMGAFKLIDYCNEDNKTELPIAPIVAAYSYQKGNYISFAIREALPLYYWSTRPFRESIDDFLNTPEGILLKERCLESAKKMGVAGYDMPPEIKTLFSEKAALDGIKRKLVLLVEFLEKIMAEKYPKDCSNGLKADENDLEVVLNFPENNLLLAKIFINLMGTISTATTDYLKKEFPNSSVIACYVGEIPADILRK